MIFCCWYFFACFLGDEVKYYDMGLQFCVCVSRTLFPYIFPATLTFLTSAALTPSNERLVGFILLCFSVQTFFFLLECSICITSVKLQLQRVFCLVGTAVSIFNKSIPIFSFKHLAVLRNILPVPNSSVSHTCADTRFAFSDIAVCFCTFSIQWYLFNLPLGAERR